VVDKTDYIELKVWRNELYPAGLVTGFDDVRRNVQ